MSEPSLDSVEAILLKHFGGLYPADEYSGGLGMPNKLIYSPKTAPIKQAKAALDKHYASKFIELINSVEISEELSPQAHVGKRATQFELKSRIKELWDV